MIDLQDERNLTLTDEQEKILSEIPPTLASATPRIPASSYVIEARAGAGKTFILTRLARQLPRDGICLAFNRSIARELQRRMPEHVPAQTFHALGLRILRERLPSKMDVNSRKLMELGKKLSSIPEDFLYPATQLASAMKVAGLGLATFPTPDDVDSLIHLSETQGITPPEGFPLPTLFPHAIRLFKRSLRELTVVDYDDMLYYPLMLRDKYGWDLRDYSFLMVDEAQDVSPLRLALLKALTHTVIAVGDPYQSVYRFAGAAADALSQVRDHYEAATYTLSYSFRCPTNITAYATSLIQPASVLSLPENVGGEIRRATSSELGSPAYPLLDNTTVVLGRMNAPLFRLALRLLRTGTPFSFRSDLPRQLISQVKRFKSATIDEFQIKLNGWYQEAKTRLEDRPKPPRALLAMLKDKYDTLAYLGGQHEDPETLIRTLEDLTDKENPLALTISTIHKAKGLEWPHVYLIRPDQLPAPFAKSPEDLEQERNLHYVAVTRASKTFTYFDEEE